MLTNEVKNFLDVNVDLLDTDPLEFFHMAYNGLSVYNQRCLIHVLTNANIDNVEAREHFIRFHITMSMEELHRPISLDVFISRYVEGILGFDHMWIFDYILDNMSEWDNKIEVVNGVHYIFPNEDNS